MKRPRKLYERIGRALSEAEAQRAEGNGPEVLEALLEAREATGKLLKELIRRT